MSLVEVHTNDYVCTLKLNRPDKLNALSWDLIDALADQLKLLGQEARAGKIRVLLVGTTNARAFCAGADLAERLKMSDPKVVETLNKLKVLTSLMAAFPTPTIAVMEGVAFGGGFEIALACDLRIAAEDAQMGLTEVNLAILPGAGGTQRLPKLIGPAKAKEFIFLARKLSGIQARTEGIVNEATPEPWTLAEKWSQEIAQKGPLALHFAKESIDGGLTQNLEEGLQWERTCYLKLLNSDDRKEGLLAFSEKRIPAYKGK